MARCAAEDCGRWRPEVLVRRGAGANVDGRWFCSRQCIERMARRRWWMRGRRPRRFRPCRRCGSARFCAITACASRRRSSGRSRRSASRIAPRRAVAAPWALTERQAVLRALAAQAGVSYLANVDAALRSQGPGRVVARRRSRPRRVPIGDAENGRIRVACPAPVPRRALGAFRQLTGWTPEALLVSDDGLADPARQLRQRSPVGISDRPVAEFMQVETLSDAAAGSPRPPRAPATRW